MSDGHEFERISYLVFQRENCDQKQQIIQFTARHDETNQDFDMSTNIKRQIVKCGLEKVDGAKLRKMHKNLQQILRCSRILRYCKILFKRCVVSEWTQVSSCSATCGGGSQIQTRRILRPAPEGGSCPALSRTVPCNTQPCPRTSHRVFTPCASARILTQRSACLILWLVQWTVCCRCGAMSASATPRAAAAAARRSRVVTSSARPPTEAPARTSPLLASSDS